MTPEAFEQAVSRLLQAATTMTLATCSGSAPWAADVYFAADGYDLLFMSAPQSRHCLNLASNPACAVTVHAQAESWREIRGLQMEGQVSPIVSVNAKALALAVYLAKFPFAAALLGDASTALGRFHKAALYVFRPARLLYLDNALGVGKRYGLRFEEGVALGAPELERGG